MKIQQIIKVFNLWIGLQKLKFNYKYKEQKTEGIFPLFLFSIDRKYFSRYYKLYS